MEYIWVNLTQKACCLGHEVNWALIGTDTNVLDWLDGVVKG